MIEETIVKTCMNLKSNETFLIVTDNIKKHLAKNIFNEARKISEHSKIILNKEMENNGEEPTKEVYNEMQKSDVIILLTNKSLTHTKARRDATTKGARIVSMPGITEDIFNRSIDVDYEEMGKRNLYLRNIIKPGSKIHMTSKQGTDITCKITFVRGVSWGLYHKPGEYGNLPAAEVDSGVINTNGKLVLDGSMAGIGKLNSKLTITIQNNYAIDIQGDKSDELKEILDSVGKEAYKIAELGIGTNDKAIVTGIVLEDEKVYGTAHMALGNDLSYQGTNDIPLHLDGVFSKPTIYVDDVKIIENGEILTQDF